MGHRCEGLVLLYPSARPIRPILRWTMGQNDRATPRKQDARMISLHTEQLSKTEQLELQKLFLSPGFKILLSVIDAECKQRAVEALKSALEAGKYSAKFDAADESLNAAQAASHAITLLTILSEQDTHKIVRLA